MNSELTWFVLRSLSRSNCKVPMYRQLAAKGYDVFTPVKTVLSVEKGHRVKRIVPVLADLLFLHATREVADALLRDIPTLQYRFVKGQAYGTVMTVTEVEMTRFITAVTQAPSVKYYTLEELTAAMHGKRIRIIGGLLDGMEGELLTTRGSKKKRLLLQLADLCAAGIEVEPDYIQLL